MAAGTGIQMTARSFKFYYDVVCPFAYMASTLVEKVAERTGASVIWTPVLLGGLYDLTHAAQGKGGSATDVMSPAKLEMSGKDLQRQMVRRGVTYREPRYHPQKTVTAMRMLSAISSNATRVAVSKALYQAYWCDQKDVSDLETLQEAVAPHGMTASELLGSDSASQTLRSNTAEAAQKGAFGVPSFSVGGNLYWGTDRVFFVERALGLDSHPERLISCVNPGTAELSFFFDYSSPWSYVAMERLESMVSSVLPVTVKIEWVPILLGALFKKIGTPMVPMATVPEVKRNYYQQDLRDWCKYAGVELRWPDTFPLRTVLPLRVTLVAACDPKLIKHLFNAAWRDNKNIGDPKVLEGVLEQVSTPMSGKALIERGGDQDIKTLLVANTKRAVDEGICGVPTFQVNGGEMVWGQDKMNVVADMLCGWQSPSNHTAKL